MTAEKVRTLVELRADDGTLVPVGAKGEVIGHAGERLVVKFVDQETDTSQTAECERWEVRRA